MTNQEKLAATLLKKEIEAAHKEAKAEYFERIPAPIRKMDKLHEEALAENSLYCITAKEGLAVVARVFKTLAAILLPLMFVCWFFN